MTPAELLDDHARRPRNIGKLLNASAVGDVGSIVAGDALRFYISVAKDADGAERITAAKYQVFNCQDQLGPASVVSEIAQGLTLDEATALGPKEVCAKLGGLDHADLPPRLWASEGLRAAIASWSGDELPADAELDPLLCRCLGIPEETVRQAVSVRGLATVDAVVEATGAGSVCGSCRTDMPRLLGTGEKPSAAASASSTGSMAPMTRIQLMRRIQAAAEEKFLPALRAQGGDLELWDFRDARVLVRAKGALAGDDHARRAALAAFEALLRSEIDPTLGVAE